jgi:hypothetical protein
LHVRRQYFFDILAAAFGTREPILLFLLPVLDRNDFLEFVLAVFAFEFIDRHGNPPSFQRRGTIDTNSIIAVTNILLDGPEVISYDTFAA